MGEQRGRRGKPMVTNRGQREGTDCGSGWGQVRGEQWKKRQDNCN